MHAVGVLEAGLCRYVLISYGHDARSGDSMKRVLLGMSDYDTVFGHFGATAKYAMAARRAMHEFQTGPETWKQIAMGQRKWANLNPRALMYDRPMTGEDYDRSPWVVEPFRLNDNCLVTDGGRACIITTLGKGPGLAPLRPLPSWALACIIPPLNLPWPAI